MGDFMRIGLQIPNFTWPITTSGMGARLAEIARHAEEVGIYSLWVMDHFFQIRGIGPMDDPMLEAYSTLSYLAGVTERVKLGTLVTGVVYRNPGVLVKTVTTLDVISDGRAYFGIGAAWFEGEANALGIPWPSTSERFEQLEETLQIAHHTWRGETGPYTGKHFQMESTLGRPLPISQPHPPILIGGMGERKTLRMVAQYADACNFSGDAGDDTMRHKMNVLRNWCDELGRDFDEIEKTVYLYCPEAQSPESLIERIKTYAEIGFTHTIFAVPDLHTLTPLDAFAAIIPEVKSISPES